MQHGPPVVLCCLFHPPLPHLPRTETRPRTRLTGPTMVAHVSIPSVFFPVQSFALGGISERGGSNWKPQTGTMQEILWYPFTPYSGHRGRRCRRAASNAQCDPCLCLLNVDRLLRLWSCPNLGIWVADHVQTSSSRSPSVFAPSANDYSPGTHIPRIPLEFPHPSPYHDTEKQLYTSTW